MRYDQSTLKASTVHAYANQLLRQTLEIQSFQPAVPLAVVASVLLLAACWQTSLTGACRLVQQQPSHRLVRQALYGCLPPKPRDLLDRLLAMLWQTLPDYLGRLPRVLAIDLHQRPYYGKKTTKGCTCRQKKKSTRKSFTYATLAALHHGGRFTLGLVPTYPTMRLTTIVERLLDQAAAAGVSCAYLLLDKDFYAAEVIALLQRRGVPFLMPAKKTGSKAGCGNHHLFAKDCAVGWYDYQWTAPLRRWDFGLKQRQVCGEVTVQIRLCVARQGDDRLVYASWGLLKWPPAQVVLEYRRRFGIETSYRQLGSCLAVTSSRNERLRLLLVGIALLWCNLWAYLHAEVFGRGPCSERTRRLDCLRLHDLLVAMAAVIADQFGGWCCQWPTYLPLPDKLATIQT